jgi:predicted enzyme related to lactoylglutathione lyase
MATQDAWQKFRDEPSPHFAIEADDIEAAQALIPTIGGEILQEIRTRPHDSSLYFFALDPDGNRFEVTQHLEATQR